MSKATLQIDNIVQAKSIVSTILRLSGLELDQGHACHILAGMYAHFFYKDKTGRKHYIKFDRENFMSFGQQFREYNCTIGETIDKSVLDDLDDNDIIYFAKPDRVYFINVQKIRNSCRDRINDTDNSKTVSFPIKLLERLEGT